jgi:uncharacterized membrane protein
MKEFFGKLGETLGPYRGRLTGLTAGLIMAILFLTIGFFKTLLIIICVIAGFIIGYFFDDRNDFGNMIDRIMSRVKGEK